MQWLRPSATLASLIFLLGSCSLAPEEGTQVTALEGATVFDGTGAEPVENAVLIIKGETVTAVGKSGEVQIPEGAIRVDASGKFIIPGLINAHGHVGSATGLSSSPSSYSEENIAAQLERYLTYGVTAVLSLGSDRPLIYELQARQQKGNLPGARVYTAGRGLGLKGGYGPGEVSRKVETPADVLPHMEELAAEKPDATKIWVDDSFGTLPKMNPEIYRAFVRAAKEKGLKSFAHVYYLEDSRGLVEAGVDVLAHSIRDQEVDDAFVALARERGVCLLPTLARELSTFVYADRPEFLDDPFFTKYEDPDVVTTLKSDEYVQQAQSAANLSRYRANLVMAQKNLKKLHEGGVKIGFATDTGPPGRIQGFFEHVELELMVEAGLTPAEALKAATSASAECLGDENLGALTPGRQADFIVLDADPLTYIKNTRRITSVWQRGVRVRGPIL
ncbi:MAG: amidohydrolase family protein [Acidobacteria bacterium]|nr:amidohydrolase family protein [Acidobacteriota bacterium]